MMAKIVSKETIKPCSHTPSSFNLSFLDQVSPPVYTKLYFFYKNSSSDDIAQVVAERSRCLKYSLSKVLTHFYPFVGRIRDKLTVNLEKDDGAEFVEARVGSTLLDYLEKPNHEMLLHLVPSDFWELGTRPLLIIQASFFKCGGLAIGMNFSHKVSDAATFTSFINAWADTAIGKRSDKVENNPDFSGSLAFPALDEELFSSGEGVGDIVELNEKMKRFVFTASKIAALQEKTTNENISWTSRQETIATFIWRVRMKMSMIKRACASGSLVPSVLITFVNIRRRLPPPICDQTFGNLVETQIVPNESGEIELPYLISLYRKQVKESREAYVKNLDEHQITGRITGIEEKMTELILEPVVKNVFTVTSWNKFPFYEADFGWGKPIWVATHDPLPHSTTLMDTRDGTGIEAWVNLPEEEMAIFSSDEELLAYAISDPSPLQASNLD